MRRIISFLLLINTLAATQAYAADKSDPLKDEPAVRKRILYLPKRLEVTPSLGVSFLQDYKHSFLVGARVEYHLNDYFSFGFSAHYSPLSMNTGLTDEIMSTLPSELEQNTYVNPTPSKSAMEDALDTLRVVVGPHVSYTPAFGKMGLFSSLFFNFDLYFYAGVAFVQFEAGNLSKYVDTSTDSKVPQDHKLHIDIEEENGGWQIGPQAGFGLRIYLNRWIALNAEFRWIYVKRNQAGFDQNGDRNYETLNDVTYEYIRVDSKDAIWENTMFFHFGASFFLPRYAPRSE
ncbi:MAG: outer membrane beta-barrel domain-containing protein [Deltaproteobacteria bacterium]|nr:outer membrane beta-barrel domain-containing protein [Deltaproteobacteria bacterium]